MKKLFSLLTLLGFAAGILFGLFFSEYCPYISFLGTWYIKILKVFIFPVIFTSIASTIYRTAKKRNGLVIKSVICFTVMFAASFLISSLLVAVIDPAKGFVPFEGDWSGQSTDFSIVAVLSNLFPRNLSDVFVNPKVFFIILAAWLTGHIGALFGKTEGFFEGIEKAKDLVTRLLGYFMYLTPLAVFSLMADTVSRYGSELLGMGFSYIAAAYVCSAAVILLVMILPVWFICGIKPLAYVRKLMSIWIITITTCSSAAALPYTVKLCRDEFGVPPEITDVVVPLGCTIHMCGGAVSFSLLGLFCARMYSIEINFPAFLLMLAASLLINMAAPGIPGGGIVIGASYLAMFGIPLGFIGFYSGIYKFLDMSYTTLNVTGDISANMILDRMTAKRP